MSHEIAKAAVEEAKLLLLNTEGDREDIADALNLALRTYAESP